MKESNRGSFTFLLLLISYVALSIGYSTIVRSLQLPTSLALFHGMVDLVLPILGFFLITKLPWKKVMRAETSFSPLTFLWVVLIFIISLPMKVAVSTIAQMFTGADATAVTMLIGSFSNNFLVLFVTIAVMPALLEEFIMRGIVLHYYRNIPPMKAAVVTGIMFGILHLDLGQLPYTAFLGVVIALIVIYTRNIWYGVIFHFLNNFLGVIGLWAISMVDELGFTEQLAASVEASSQGFSFPTLISSLVSLLAFSGLMYLAFKALIKSVPAKEVDPESEDVMENPSWLALLLNPSMITTYLVATALIIIVR